MRVESSQEGLRKNDKLSVLKVASLLGAIFLSTAVVHADVPTDDVIRKTIIAESLRTYPGTCPCPYNTDRAGRQCGRRSAWSKAGGYAPICYANEVSDEQVRGFRERVLASRG
jgi:hypothetical protein